MSDDVIARNDGKAFSLFLFWALLTYVLLKLYVLFILHLRLKTIFLWNAKILNKCYQMFLFKFKWKLYAEFLYIGETKGHLITRVDEHVPIDNSSNKFNVLKSEECKSGVSSYWKKMCKKWPVSHPSFFYVNFHFSS